MKGKLSVALVSALFIPAALWAQKPMPNGSAPASAYRVSDADTRPLTPKEAQIVKEAVAEVLIDPTTPLFKLGPQIKTSSRYCGGVNSKNRLGGYVGNQTFGVIVQRDATGKIVSAAGAQVVTRNMTPPVQEMALGCLEDGYPMLPF